MTLTGFEPSANSPMLSQGDEKTNAESDALCGEIDPDLARVIEAWPRLPAAVRAAITDLIETETANERK